MTQICQNEHILGIVITVASQAQTDCDHCGRLHPFVPRHWSGSRTWPPTTQPTLEVYI